MLASKFHDVGLLIASIVTLSDVFVLAVIGSAIIKGTSNSEQFQLSFDNTSPVELAVI